MLTGLLLLTAVLVALLRRRAIASQIRAFLAWRASPIDLAVARIVVFGLLAFDVLQAHVPWFAGLPAALLAPPPGAGWVASVLPLTPAVARGAAAVTAAAALLAAAGCWSRSIGAIAVLSGAYVLGIPQLWGKVNHDHNLLWFGAILAASHCGDAWSIDALRRPRPTKRALAYGLPLRLIALGLGVVYFFPGLWKAGMGDAWWWSDNLRHQLWLHWLQAGVLPPLRLDVHPGLLHVAALATIAFELSFVALILWPVTRKLAIAGGLSFHAMSAVAMGINFWPVWPCYVVLVDWAALLRRRTRAQEREVPRLGFPRAAVVAGCTVLAGELLTGALRINSWPFAAYPAFAFIAPDTARTVELELLDADGRVIAIDSAVARLRRHFESSRFAAVLDRVVSAEPHDRDRVAGGLVAALRREDPAIEGGTTAVLYVVRQPIDPARWGEGSRRWLATVRLAPKTNGSEGR